MEAYSQAGADVTDIEDYVQDTYGQTLAQLRLASRGAMLIAVLVGKAPPPAMCPKPARI